MVNELIDRKEFDLHSLLRVHDLVSKQIKHGIKGGKYEERFLMKIW